MPSLILPKYTRFYAITQLLGSGQRTTAGIEFRRAHNVLVVAEVGLSLILLVMAGLMIRSFAKLTNIDPGMSTSNVMTMRINRSPARFDHEDIAVLACERKKEN